ncbi:MAG: hypothetical protein ACO39T_05580 [Flavobacteriaceae bacterium]
MKRNSQIGGLLMAQASTKVINYTSEMVEKMVAMYSELGNDGLDQIAEAMDKSVRSVRSKLVREGVYIASPKGKPSSSKSQEPTKKELLNQLEEIVGFDCTPLTGATKQGLAMLIDYTQQQA